LGRIIKSDVPEAKREELTKKLSKATTGAEIQAVARDIKASGASFN
jgi:hypothetical protein